MNPERAKKLKELGVKQKSFAFWSEIDVATMLLYCEDWSPRDDGDISAFTVAELGEILSLMWYVSYKEEKTGN